MEPQGPPPPPSPTSMGSTPRQPADGATSSISAAVAGLSFLATILVLLGAALPLVTFPDSSENASFLDCKFEGCSWLLLPVIGSAAAIAIGGVLALVERRHRVAGPMLVVGGILTSLTFLGWTGLLGAQTDEFSVTSGAAGPVGIIAGIVALTAGVVGLSRASSSAPTGAPVDERPAAQMLGARRRTVGPAVLALVGAALVLIASSVPYVRFAPGSGDLDHLAILGCDFGGCGWYAVEPIGLAIAIAAVGILTALGSMHRIVIASAFAILGLWTVLLFMGFSFSFREETYGPGSSSGPSGLIGIAAGLLVLVAGAISLYLGRERAEESVSPGADQPAT